MQRIAVATRVPMITVPRKWPGGTVVCLATGPSLTQADVNYVQGKVDGVIAVSNAFALAPWADCLYSCDSKWWRWNWEHGAKQFAGLKYALDTGASRFPGVQVLRNTGDSGLELKPHGLHTGKNSGFQAINLAVHFGAARIVLLGYDLQSGADGRKHVHGDHPDRSAPPYALCLRHFSTLVEPLRTAGIEIVNCTRRTALACFPQRLLEDVFGAGPC